MVQFFGLSLAFMLYLKKLNKTKNNVHARRKSIDYIQKYERKDTINGTVGKILNGNIVIKVLFINSVCHQDDCSVDDTYGSCRGPLVARCEPEGFLVPVVQTESIHGLYGEALCR